MANRGLDLSVWGWTPKKDLLGSELGLLQFLSALCKQIHMEPLRSTSVNVPLELGRLNKTPREDEGGASAVLILSTSHAAIHGWPERHPDHGYFSLQVSSCREFGLKESLNFIRSELVVTKMEHSALYTSAPKI